MELFNQGVAEVRKLEYYGIDKDVAEAFIKSLVKHVTCVQEAGVELGVDAQQLEFHDLSKLLPDEFIGYANHFHGGKLVDASEFAKSWLHHIHHNPHHWQHWMFPDEYKKGSVNGVVQMPTNYALEMIADWMGAGKAYEGSSDITEWLMHRIPHIHLHPETSKYVKEILQKLNYADSVLSLEFACGRNCNCK